MPIDFAEVRKKLAKISGQNSTRDAYWKPEQDTTYTIRIVPFTNNEGQPFKERYFYYNIGKNPGLLTPNQFGKKDPIQELIDSLRADGTPESREMCKTLYPKMRAYAAVIVRGEEDKGPRLWSFGKNVYQSLLGLILDEDYGDITDVSEGRDIKVTVTKPPGAQYAKTDITVRPKQSALSDDSKLVTKWLDAVPDIDAIMPLKSYEELEKIINEWVAGGEADTEAQGTERGGKTPAAEETTKVEVVAETKGVKKAAKVHKDIDSAFDDIIGSND